MTRLRLASLSAAALAVAGAATMAFALPPDPYASAPAYLVPVAPHVTVSPIVTVGQRIPLTDGLAGDTFRFVGLPDGLGVYRRCRETVLLVNHEFGATAGAAAGPLPSGARISELILSTHRGGHASSAAVVSGKNEIERVYEGEPAVLSPAGRRFTRFCSAFLATEDVGFDRPVFLTGEESGGAGTFDGQGGSVFATVDGSAYQLPRMGHASWENVVVAPFTGKDTVAFGLEDGSSAGTALHSQVYMYVGRKDRHGADPIAKNGLRGGRLYVLAYDDPAAADEATFTAKGASTGVHWVEVNPFQSDVALDAQSKAVGSFNFVRVEDGAAHPKKRGVFYFVTTGGPGTVDPYGRLYRLDWDNEHPTASASLTLVLDGSEGVVSPDNIDVNKHGEIALCEDPNYNLASLGLSRDSSVWIYDTKSAALTRVAEVDRPAAKAHAFAADAGNTSGGSGDSPGGWESSGVIDAEDVLGRGSWLIDVQAHGLRIVPTAETVEGGQILHLVVKPGRDRDRDCDRDDD